MQSEIEGLITAAMKALLERDALALDSLLHHRFLYYPPVDDPLTKEHFIRDFTSLEMVIRLDSTSEILIDPSGISATAMHEFEGEYNWRGLGGIRKYRLTHTLFRNAEGWQIIATSVRPLRPELEMGDEHVLNYDLR